ncbi:MAG: hypothetical protein KBC84_09575, partial [Proteobacteria bacterium]|nr:hypothetical protein [Pseudomonadota bacterium]
MAGKVNTVNIQAELSRTQNLQAQSQHSDSYLSSLLLLGSCSYHNLKELNGYVTASMSGYASAIKELATTGDSNKASLAFERVANSKYQSVREEAQKSHFGSILGSDKELAELGFVGSAIHSIGVVPQLISQPIAMLINSTGIEISRRVLRPEMDFYEFAQLEDKDPTLRAFKSARQVSVLAAITLATGSVGAFALGTTAGISSLSVLGNRLLLVGREQTKDGETKLQTFRDLLLNPTIVHEILDASFNSRSMSLVTPYLLGFKMAAKAYDNVDTVNDAIVSVASGQKVGNLANILSDSDVALRSLGFTMLTAAATMDLFDVSFGNFNANGLSVGKLARIQEDLATQKSTPQLPSSSVSLNESLSLPNATNKFILVGHDENNLPIYASRNSRVFYLDNLATLVNPASELRAQGFYSAEVDKLVDEIGASAARIRLSSLLGLTDLSPEGQRAFVVNKLSDKLFSDLELAVSSHVQEQGMTLSTEEYSQLLDWNIKRLQRAIQIHELNHLRNGAEEQAAWEESNQFLAFTGEELGDSRSIPLEFYRDGLQVGVSRLGKVGQGYVRLAQALESNEDFARYWTGGSYHVSETLNFAAFSPNAPLVLNSEIAEGLSTALTAVRDDSADKIA